MARTPSTGSTRFAAGWSVPLALFAAALAVSACRAREGDRCVCAEDCREGLLCVASGRVLADGECSPAVGQDGSPGVCLSEDEAAEDEGGGGQAEPFMDMGSKLDFEPGPPPDADTESSGATTEATGSTSGTTDATGTTSGTTDATGTGTTDATGTGTTSGTTDATGTGTTGTGTTGVGT